MCVVQTGKFKFFRVFSVYIIIILALDFLSWEKMVIISIIISDSQLEFCSVLVSITDFCQKFLYLHG